MGASNSMHKNKYDKKAEGSRKIGEDGDSENSLSPQLSKEDETFQFFVRMCGDVLLEMLYCGNRQQLVKLERVGRRIHLMVENFVGERPFLRHTITFEIKLRMPNGLIDAVWYQLVLFYFSRTGLEAFIGRGRKAISLADLKAFPKFFRFNGVNLTYWSVPQISQSIEKKCQLFGDFLPSIKGALSDSNEIYFNCIIGEQFHFGNHSTFLDYLRDEFLTICDSARRYLFCINFFSDENSATEVIAAILKMPQIVRCSNVEITLAFANFYDPIQLPVDEITQWLNLKTDRIGLSAKKKEEKFLTIYSRSKHVRNFQNILEMRDHLIEEFNKANVPSTPFSFSLEFSQEVNELDEQTLTNKRTNEEFSIKKMERWKEEMVKMERSFGYKIKRATKANKDS